MDFVRETVMFLTIEWEWFRVSLPYHAVKSESILSQKISWCTEHHNFIHQQTSEQKKNEMINETRDLIPEKWDNLFFLFFYFISFHSFFFSSHKCFQDSKIHTRRQIIPSSFCHVWAVNKTLIYLQI